jgi:hypothetical protein
MYTVHVIRLSETSPVETGALPGIDPTHISKEDMK